MEFGIAFQSICVQEGSGVPNLQTELNYLVFKKQWLFLQKLLKLSRETY